MISAITNLWSLTLALCVVKVILNTWWTDDVESSRK